MSEHNMSEHRHFGRYLRRIREDRKLSLDAVEEMTVGYPEPVTKSHLSRIENGRAVPTFPRMFALCQVYGVPISSMAERFETDLRRQESSEDVETENADRLFVRIDQYRKQGRYDQILRVTMAALETLPTGKDATADVRNKLTVWQIGAMIKLAHYESCKLKCEQLMSDTPQSSEFHLRALVSFVICCYRLGRIAVALIGLAEAEKMLSCRDWPSDLKAIAHSTRGSVYFLAGDMERARAGFEKALTSYEEIGNDAEVCREKSNIAQLLIDRGQLRAAERYLTSSMRVAEAQRFKRQIAVGFSHFAVLYFKCERFDNAERAALKSNRYAREIGHQAVVFRNCFYLWKIAKLRGDRSAMTANERNLRTLVDRVPQTLTEVDLFRRERDNR